MKNVILKAKKAGSERTKRNEANLHSLAVPRIPKKDDISIKPDGLEKLLIERTNE